MSNSKGGVPVSAVPGDEEGRAVLLSETPEYHRDYYRRNMARRRAASRRYYEGHRDQHIAATRAWQAANRDRVRGAARRRRLTKKLERTLGVGLVEARRILADIESNLS